MEIVTTTTEPPPTIIQNNETVTEPNSFESFISFFNSEHALTIGFSIFLLIGTLVWVCIWCKGRKQLNKRRTTKSRDIKGTNKSPSRPNDRNDGLPGFPKTPSLASIQSTGSNYYDQLMGSGNIPKVKSISQYGALLAQQEPPPP